MTQFLAKQAEILLEETDKDDNKRRTILQLLQEKNPQSTIEAITDFKFAPVLLSLIFYFPLKQESEDDDYVDFLAEHFPAILFSSMFKFSNESIELSPKNTLTKIQGRYASLLSDEGFANRFLDYYTQRLIKKSTEECQLFIELCWLPPAVITRYCKQNEEDKNKFFNKFLGGFGSSFVFFVFGYGFLYGLLYGTTNDQIIEDLQSALKKICPKRWKIIHRHQYSHHYLPF